MKLLLALLLGLAALPAQALIDRAAAIRAASSVMRIEVQRAKGGLALGSGVAVAADMVVTNCHVTHDALAIDVLRGGLRWRAEAQASDTEHDLCVLRVPAMQLPAVVLRNSGELRAGEAVLALGYTGGMEMQHSEGEIVALHLHDGARVPQISNGFNSGASGGGLFDEQLRLIGILTFRLRGGAAHYFAAPIDWLQALMAAPAAFRAVAPLPAGQIAYWQQPTATQPNFLQAAVLERERRWDELELLAFNWTRTAAQDPQPWYLHGLALDKLRRWPESQRALEQALLLAPAQADAWFQLGMVYAEQGQIDRARQARGRLEALRSDLADTLGRAIDGR